MDRYQGAEYDVIFLDEATQLKEEWMRQFAACLRGVNGFPKRLYYTCNPGGPGHGYIKRLFIDRRFQAGENPEDYVFIPAKVTDNRALLRAQPDYLRQLQALPRRLRDAWLDGKWDVFQGQVFQEFTNDPAHYQDRRFTHVIAPFDIPREWRVYRSYDFGYAKPFSCGWWAVDHDGVILSDPGAVRLHRGGGCRRAVDAGAAIRGDPPDRGHPSLAEGPGDPGGGGPGHLGYQPGGRAFMRRLCGTGSISPGATTGVSPDGCSCTTA